MNTAQKGTLQTCLSGAWGGLEMVAFEVAAKMRDNGHFVTTVCLPNSPLHQKLAAAGLDWIAVERKRRYFAPECVRVLRQALLSGKYSAVLIQQMNELWQVVPALRGLRAVRLVGISHTFLAISKKDLLHRLLYGRMNNLIALSDIHKQNLLQNLPVKANAVEVLPNGVDTEKFNPARRSEALRKTFLNQPNQLLIGVVSRLDLGKGIMEVVTVADELRQSGVVFKMILVGTETASEGGAKAMLEREIASRKLSDLVHLIGHRSDIDTVIASLDVLLLPSPAETFGRVLIEAMASGVAVVACAGGSVPSIIQSGQNGLLAPPLSAKGMAQAIAAYYHDPEMRKRVVHNGLTCASERYDYRKLDKKLYAILGLESHL